MACFVCEWLNRQEKQNDRAYTESARGTAERESAIRDSAVISRLKSQHWAEFHADRNGPALRIVIRG